MAEKDKDPQKRTKAAKIGREIDSFFVNVLGQATSGPNSVIDLWNATASDIDDAIFDNINSLSDLFKEAYKDSSSPVLKGLAKKISSEAGDKIPELKGKRESEVGKFLQNYFGEAEKSGGVLDPNAPSVFQESLSRIATFPKADPYKFPGQRKQIPGVNDQGEAAPQSTPPNNPVQASAKSTGNAARQAQSASVSSQRVESDAISPPDRSSQFNMADFLTNMKQKVNASIEGSDRGKVGGEGLDQEALNQKRVGVMRNLENIGQAIGMGANLADYIGSRRDLNEARGLRDRIEEPVYNVRGQNRGLLRELRDAETRRMNPYGDVAPVQDQVNLGYQQDLAQSQAVSGGQASTMGTLGAGAALRRDRNLGTVAQAAQGAVGAQDARVGNLLTQQVSDDSNRDYLNLFKYQTDNQRSIMEGQAVGDAISSSRLRGIQSRNHFLDNLLTSNAFDVNSYSDYIRNSLTNRQ